MRFISIDDMFTVGVALDLLGGLLLGRGLLTSSRGMLNNAALIIGANPMQIASSIEAKVDGWAGLTALAVGFVLQAGGYAAIIGGAHIKTDTTRALISILLAAIAAAISWTIAAWTRRPRLIRQMIGVAKCGEDTDGNPIDGDLPSARMLALLGRNLKFGPFPDADLESPARTVAYAHERLGITDVATP